jgi:hypothetical protein
MNSNTYYVLKKLFFFVALSFYLVGTSSAHSGRTDSSGCHNNYSNNTYHCHNNKYQPMTNSSYQQGYSEGAAWGALLNSLMNSGSSSNSNDSSLRYRFLEKGSTWRRSGNSMISSGGKRCTDYAYESKCNNGVTYRQCGNSICGTDGTSYNRVGSCTYTSFGATCCGKGAVVCR